MASVAPMVRWLFTAAMLVCVWGGATEADAQMRATPPTRMPRDLAQVDIFLLTTEVGDDLAAKFGHTAVRVQDRGAGTDQVYNFGVFDFSDPLFGLNFFRGILRYQMADYPYVLALRAYRADGRTVWQDKLQLTVDQKRRFMEKIIWQSQPENRTYDYQYFFDNCSTRVRDFFDFAMGGAMGKYFDGKMSADTFRATVRSHMATTSFFGMSLDILMNSRLDRQMTQWEEMYLPVRLRAAFLEMPAVSDAGVVSATETFAQPLEVVHEAPAPKPDKIHAYVWMCLLFGLPLAWAWLVALRAKFFKPSTEVFNRACRIFGVMLIGWGFWAGAFGLLMACSWAFSAHLDLHHNANLLLFFPTDLILLYIGIKWMRHGYALSAPGGWWREPIKWYATLHLVGIVVLFVAELFRLITQDVVPVFWTFGVIAVFVYSFILMMQRTYKA